MRAAALPHADHFPEQGKYVFIENADGALTLKTAVYTSKRYAAIPEKKGCDNPGLHELVRVINQQNG